MTVSTVGGDDDQRASEVSLASMMGPLVCQAESTDPRNTLAFCVIAGYCKPSGKPDSTGLAHSASCDSGKGTYAMTYDSPTEHRGMVTAEDTGMSTGIPSVITADYNAAGAPSTVTYPNGVAAIFGFNALGQIVTKTYKTNAAAPADQALMGWTQLPNAFGQISYQTGPHGDQDNRYDPAGRLIQATQRGANQCTVRGYTFNANSDRTNKSETTSSDGTCASTGIVPRGLLADGVTYQMRAYGLLNGTYSSGYTAQNFTVDAINPLTPNIQSGAIANNAWHRETPVSNAFTLTPTSGDSDVSAFQI